MLAIRIFEEEGVKLYRQGLIRGYFHPYWGQEAIAVGVCANLTDRDYITSNHRGHGHSIARGAEISLMFAELLGRKTGYCKGLGGSMHIADVTRGNLGANGIVGSGLPIAAGAAYSAMLKAEDNIAVAFVSDGGTNIGSFSEAVNLAAVWHLPLLIVIENNQYAVSTPIADSTREVNLFKRGLGYGVEGHKVDGNNVLDVFEVSKDLISKCRTGEGPFILECITFRKGGHHINDPGQYLPKEKVEFFQEHDPLIIGRRILMEFAGFTESEIDIIKGEVIKDIKSAVIDAEKSPELSKKEFFELLRNYL